jgi:hypothetical protein
MGPRLATSDRVGAHFVRQMTGRAHGLFWLVTGTSQVEADVREGSLGGRSGQEDGVR